VSKIASVTSELTGTEYSWIGSDRGKPNYSKCPSAAGLESKPELSRDMPAWAALLSESSTPDTIIITRDTAQRKSSLIYSDQQGCFIRNKPGGLSNCPLF
jgi:hypothetical protein